MKKLLGIMCLMMALPVFAFNGRSFEEPINACVSHILVPTEEQALLLKSEIKTYSDFEQLAMIYSECPSGRKGGELGCFGHGQMVKPFEKAAFNGNIGEVTGPVKTQFGYHLIWITRRY